ncbi:MAG TPA: acyl-phosphate glycerol 3-phosphate acyltransferase [Clostridiales bacterium]|nr:MAG: acyl-phosphate glycerol 3-phosphate acyltransferase [Clostridiales bacterium GWD2_32_59]HAN10239.1 acyl-phosphate glycerol 3-phosphate acyltransferase [Clostridiales bacterium]
MFFNYFSGLLIGYLFGCFVTGYIVGKFIKKTDIRDFGSGNAGMTNTIRVLGWKAGFVTLLGDFFKSVFAILLAKYLFANAVDDRIIVVFTAAGVILGHNWPVFLNFRGGKGVASIFGVLAVMNFWIALMSGVFILTIMATTRYVSLASILTSILIPILFVVLDKNEPYIVFTVILAVITVYKHKDNVKRLLAGKESKIGKK